MEQGNEIVTCKSQDDTIKVDVLLADESICLTQEQIDFLFRKARNTITKHIGNVFNEG